MLTREDPEDIVDIDAEVAAFLQGFLSNCGLYKGPVHGKWDLKSKESFESWMGVENLENKVRKDGKLWGSVWRYVRERGR
jgi:uncharacterized Ntn-hydrolase superfamily protein